MHQIDIINLALTRMGQASVTSLTEGSAEAAAAAKVWDAALRSTLQEFRWGFNTRRAALSNPLNRYSNVFSPFPVQVWPLRQGGMHKGVFFQRHASKMPRTSHTGSAGRQPRVQLYWARASSSA